MSSSAPRYLVGIDLGTTHTAVAFADLEQGGADAPAQLFEIDQLIGPGRVARRPLLPSFRYHPTAGELADGDLHLPWTAPALEGELSQVVIGEWARELSAKVEGRSVASAKSWLSHPQVERTAAILPWAGAEDVAKVSPVLASASYLSHVRSAWNHHHPAAPLEQQEVVITVPASFDEAARALTLEAARLAGLPQVLLLEEPQAVCYDWYAQHATEAPELLASIRLLMVCDIGGGTTDLSLIRISQGQNGLSLTRIGVGDHLMLGGDNLDLALAHRAEQRIAGASKRLSAASLSQLIQQTRLAKERLLLPDAPDSATVTVLGAGARLIGGARRCELTREEVHAVALDGFFPRVAFTVLPERRRSAVIEFGLPYAADPAISKHLAAFLQRHQGACRDALQLTEQPEQPAVPDALLFNGGLFNSEALRERALSVLQAWRGAPITQLENRHPHLAVAFGAVAYARARRGSLLRIGGGSARSYFLRVDTSEDQPRQGVCLLPRGTSENQEIRLHERRFALRVGQPVSFNLVTSSDDTRFASGELVTLDPEHFLELPPLMAALDPAQAQRQEVAVELACTLTEVGTLRIECVSLDESDQRWQVEFQLRRQATAETGLATTAALPPRFDEARERLDQVYGQSRKDVDAKAVKTLRPDLEKLLGKRDQWDTPVLRALFDDLLSGAKRRRRSQAHERAWFNLAGFCLRPGFGFPLDDWRQQQAWPLYQQGLQFDKENQSWGEWWTFWRRAAGGLDAAQQQRIYRDIAKYFNPSALRNRKLQAELSTRSYEDMVRLVAALEHLPAETKRELGGWLLKRLEKSSETQTSWWALGRIGSRVPFHGSAHNVVEIKSVQGWVQQVLKADWTKRPNAAFAAVMLARMSGDRSRDLDEPLRRQVIERLEAIKAPPVWAEMVADVRELSEAETRRVFGEALPAGLKLID